MRLPVLWLCGPPGVGKSTVGWRVRERAVAGGAEVAYVDVDQLGTCFPEPEGDPSRTRLQARVLVRMIDGFAAEGAIGVVVSGVTDPINGPHADLLPNAALTVVRLDADAPTLRARLRSRGAGDMVGGALREAAVLAAATFSRRVVSTTGVDVDGVVDAVVAVAAGWLGAEVAGRRGAGASADAEPHAAISPAISSLPAPSPDLSFAPPPDLSSVLPPGRVLLLAGPTGVGKSTVGFAVFQQSLGAGVPTAYLDLGQLSFFPPVAAPASARATARQAAAAWAEFRVVGAQRLVAVGTVDDEAALAAYAAAFAPADVTRVRLRAAPHEHTARVLSRGTGGSWAQPGDPLRGLTEVRLREVAALAVREAAAHDAAALDAAALDAAALDTMALDTMAAGAVVDTTGRAAWDVATELGAFWE